MNLRIKWSNTLLITPFLGKGTNLWKPLQKRTKTYLAFLAIYAITIVSGHAQEQKGLVASANEAYTRYEYATAAKLYERAAIKNNKDGLIISRLASCYKEMNNYEAAEKYYNQLIALPGTAPEEWLYFADMLKSTGKYPEAKEIYQQYQQRSTNDIKNKLLGCDSASYWMAHPVEVTIDNMAPLNTAKSDWGAVFNPITNNLIFVSDSLRNTKKGIFKKAFSETIYGRTDNYFQKIYAIGSDKGDVFNNQIHDFDPVINAYEYHTGPLVFSANCDSIYFTVTYAGNNHPISADKTANAADSKYKTRRLELYLSTLNSSTGTWNKPIPFPFNSPARYSVGHAAISRDGRYLYFTSDMPGGLGGLDIWFCERLITGNWGIPKNCGNNLNTKEDEAFPVIGIDGNLYFASKGHVGMGGYDLFVASGEKNKWSHPLSLGYPFNSSGDDFYYFAKDETTGFFASNRKGGLGDDDIYQFVLNQPLAMPSANNAVVLEVKVIDNATKAPINTANLQIQNTATDVKWDQQTNINGQAWHSVDTESPYAITVSKSGYYGTMVAINTKNAKGDTLKVVIPLANIGGPKPAPKVYRLADTISSLGVGDRFRLNNIHYDFDKDNIRPDAASILDTLVDILNQYPTMIIELSSHTDSRGSDQYNVNLADRRAKSAVAYLIAHGIERRRMFAKGYGEFLLLNGCSNGVPCSEAEHQENRRTEVKILKL